VSSLLTAAILAVDCASVHIAYLVNTVVSVHTAVTAVFTCIKHVCSKET
jgi:hypothetical protein